MVSDTVQMTIELFIIESAASAKWISVLDLFFY